MTPSVTITVILLMLVVGLLILFKQRRVLRGTTLVACWWWMFAALLTLAGSLLVVAAFGSRMAWAEPLRYAGAVGCFCPLMALLGAKRPQDRAWGFIVLSLWVMLALPAAEAVFLHRGRPLEIHGARAWFLWALIALGLINLLPTRFWLSGLLMATGQILLFAPHLPFISRRLAEATDAWVMGAFAAALVAATLTPRRSDVGVGRVWLDFRDSFGTLWGLRVAQRINADAEIAGWPVTLTWSGFVFANDIRSFEELPDDVRQAIKQALHNLLRRFVSDAWIASRLS